MATLTAPAVVTKSGRYDYTATGLEPGTAYSLLVDGVGTTTKWYPKVDGTLTGSFVVVTTRPDGPLPLAIRRYGRKDDIATFTVQVLRTAPPPVDPPPTPSTSKVYGPGIMCDGKDNRYIGYGYSLGFRWKTDGGTITRFAINQRFAEDRAPGMGYSHGTGGIVKTTLQGVDQNGMPDGVIKATVTWQPNNTQQADTEDRRFINFDAPATVQAGTVLVLCHDDVHPDPMNNWMSANCLVHPNEKQPAYPDDIMATLDRKAGSYGWKRYAGNTPCFDIAFSDGHHEGQGYYSGVHNTNLDQGYGSSTTQGFTLSGARRVRERFTAKRNASVVAAWLRARRLGGSGVLTAKLGAATGQADVSFIPQTAGSSLTGAKWVRVPLVASLVSGTAYTVEFGTTAQLSVALVRGADDPATTNPPWQSPTFREGLAEKSFDGSSWSELYNDYCDLEFYLELA